MRSRFTRSNGVVARGVALLDITPCILPVLHASHCIVEGPSVSLSPVTEAEGVQGRQGPHGPAVDATGRLWQSSRIEVMLNGRQMRLSG